MKILVIGAHPDDEILGACGAICHHVAKKDEVYVCIVTKAYEPEWSKQYIKLKKIEQKKVDEFLGIKKRFNLDLPSVKLNTIPYGEFNKKIEELVKIVAPDVLYTHFEHDLNYDHTLIFRASLVATRPPNKTKILCYETLSETEWGTGVFKPNTWLDITKVIDKKIKAFQFYKSENKPFPSPRNEDGIRAIARKRGMEVGVRFAESFCTIREIII